MSQNCFALSTAHRRAVVSRIHWSLCACVSLFLLTGLPQCSAADAPRQEWVLVWGDEFDGSEIDRTKWDFDLGNGYYNYEARQWISGWGNGELQYYTADHRNAVVENGQLRIRALKESLHGCGYSSAKLKTRSREGQPLFQQCYGKFEFRAKLPTGQGLWPALWMLPQEDHYGPWAASGEIDIMEARGQNPGNVLGTLHYGGRWPRNAHTSHEFQFPQNDFSTFHVYALDWEPGTIRWLVDGKLFATQNNWRSEAGNSGAAEIPGKSGQKADLNPAGENTAEVMASQPNLAPFDRPFYLIMNLAVGGQFPGDPNAATPFPAEMVIDYVRVYRQAGREGSDRS